VTVYEADWICPISRPPIPNGAIAVENGRISKLGPIESIQGDHRVRYSGCAVIPGFVNAHTHMELTVFRGFLENVPFTEWIRKLVQTKYGLLTRDDLRLSARLGRGRLTVVTYHQVRDPADDGSSVGTADFRQQMEYLRQTYTVVPLADIMASRLVVAWNKADANPLIRSLVSVRSTACGAVTRSSGCPVMSPIMPISARSFFAERSCTSTR